MPLSAYRARWHPTGRSIPTAMTLCLRNFPEEVHSKNGLLTDDVCSDEKRKTIDGPSTETPCMHVSPREKVIRNGFAMAIHPIIPDWNCMRSDKLPWGCICAGSRLNLIALDAEEKYLVFPVEISRGMAEIRGRWRVPRTRVYGAVNATKEWRRCGKYCSAVAQLLHYCTMGR
jgi:hypothetical protein